MATLTGSEKQVSWANDIRGKMIVDVNEAKLEIASIVRAKGPEATAKMVAYFKANGPLTNEALSAAQQDLLDNETSAAWWIDNRMKTLARLAAEKVVDEILG